MSTHCNYCLKSSSNKFKLCSKCLNCGYCSKECQKNAWQSHKLLCSSSVEVLNINTNSSNSSMKGLFARESFQVGDIILKEKPLLAVPYADIDHIDKQIETSFNQLSQASKNAVYDLCDTTTTLSTETNTETNVIQVENSNNSNNNDCKTVVYENAQPNIKTLRGILTSNSIPQGDMITPIDGSNNKECVLPTACLYSLLCRANHSCNSNAIFTWREDLQKELLIAMRKIEKGDEITVSYDGVCEDRDYRRQRLKDNFNFDCGCTLCVDNEEKVEEGLKIIACLKNQINLSQQSSTNIKDSNDNQEEEEEDEEAVIQMKTEMCIVWGEKALATAIEIDMSTPMHVQHLHEALALLYFKAGNNEEAVKHYMLFTKFRDICQGNRV